MDVLSAINSLITLTTTIGNLVTQAGTISAIVRQAQSEGRATLTPAEWNQINQSDEVGKAALLDAISKALAPKAT